MSESDIMQVEEEVVADSFAWYWIVVGILALLGLGYVIYFWLSRNKAVKSLSENVSIVMGDMPEGSKKQENRGTELEGENILVAKPSENYFDRSRSAISLLGTFNVRDKEGNDITSNFTPRLKSLLVLLILYTERTRRYFDAEDDRNALVG